jgi:hypothetical protein
MGWTEGDGLPGIPGLEHHAQGAFAESPPDDEPIDLDDVGLFHGWK